MSVVSRLGLAFGVTLLAAGVGGCGDDSAGGGGGRDGAPSDGGADRTSDASTMNDRMGDGGGNADAGTYSVIVAAAEVTGPLSFPPDMQSVFLQSEIDVFAPGFRNDSPAAAPGDCIADAFDRTSMPADLPPNNGDMGGLSFTGYGGRGSSAMEIPASIMCTRVMSSLSPGRMFYSCPNAETDTPVPFNGGMSDIFRSGDMLAFTATGGMNVGAWSATVPVGDTVMLTSSLGNIDPTRAFEVTFAPVQGQVGLFLISNDNSDPRMAPTAKYGVVSCVVDGTSGRITVPAAKLALIDSTPWRSIAASLVALGATQTPSDGRGSSIRVSGGQGVFDLTFR